MYKVGSGDINAIMTKNKNTFTYKKFIKKFFGIDNIVYNAENSPIDALRVGAILEKTYFSCLSLDWYEQIKVVCEQNPICVSTLDFSKLRNGKVVDFIELKTIQFSEFIKLDDESDIKKEFFKYYTQIQFQLMCTGLKKARLRFLCVYDYDDESNKNREIKDFDVKEYIVERDEIIINEIIYQIKPFEEFRKIALGGK